MGAPVGALEEEAPPEEEGVKEEAAESWGGLPLSGSSTGPSVVGMSSGAVRRSGIPERRVVATSSRNRSSQ